MRERTDKPRAPRRRAVAGRPGGRGIDGGAAPQPPDNGTAPAPAPTIVTASQPAPTTDDPKGITRRDLLVAGVGVVAGVATTGLTAYAMDRLGPAVASSNLEAFPAIDWSPDGAWVFYAAEPIDLADQPDQFGSPEGGFSKEAIDYLVTRGCVRQSPLLVHLHLSRPGNAAAVIHDIRVVNHRREPALTGASYLSETAGSNANTVMAVDLDAVDPVAVQADLRDVLYGGDISGRPPAFSTSTFSVEPHLTETVTIGFLTSEGQHSFRLRLHYFVEGREHTLVVPEDDDLLRVTQAAEADERYELPWYDDVYRYVRTT